jgi:hypothetical protein
MREYKKNHLNPISFIPGAIPGSRPLLPEINLIRLGLQKAINTEAAVCIPGVWAKISMVNPRTKEDVSNNHPGVSKGSSSINNTYRYGLIYPLTLILFNTKTWIKTSTIKRTVFLTIILFIL